MHTSVGVGQEEEKNVYNIQHVRLFTYLPKENSNHNNITNSGHGKL